MTASPPTPSPLRAWLAAARPRTLPAAMTPVLVGTALAIADNVFHPLAALAALIGALLIQVGTNFANDYFDFRKGADTADRLGPPRATAQGWVTPGQMARATAITMTLALLVGIYLAIVGGWPIIVIGLASILSGVLYTGGPLPLAYIGLGDLFVFVFFGLVAVGGTYYVQALAWPPDHVWYAATMVGCIATAILVVNNLRDRHTDAAANKRTVAVMFGARFARVEYTLLIGVAFSTAIAAVALGHMPIGWLLPLLGLPLAIIRTRAVWRTDGVALNPLLGGTAQLGLIVGALLAVGANLPIGGAS